MKTRRMESKVRFGSMSTATNQTTAHAMKHPPCRCSDDLA